MCTSEFSESTIAENLRSFNGWTYQCKAIEKRIVCKDFGEAIALQIRIALIAEKMNHHPEYYSAFNQLTIRLSTHDAGGVTHLDFLLALEIEKLLN